MSLSRNGKLLPAKITNFEDEYVPEEEEDVLPVFESPPDTPTKKSKKLKNPFKGLKLKRTKSLAERDHLGNREIRFDYKSFFFLLFQTGKTVSDLISHPLKLQRREMLVMRVLTRVP